MRLRAFYFSKQHINRVNLVKNIKTLDINSSTKKIEQKKQDK